MRTLPLSILATAALVGTAFAQNSTTPHNQAQNPNQSGQTQRIGQQVRTNLEQAGFTDIKIVPESFMVRAKDKNGNPVMMIIDPDSVTSVTEINNGGSTSSTTGSAGRNSGSTGSSTTSPSSK